MREKDGGREGLAGRELTGTEGGMGGRGNRWNKWKNREIVWYIYKTNTKQINKHPDRRIKENPAKTDKKAD